MVTHNRDEGKSGQGYRNLATVNPLPQMGRTGMDTITTLYRCRPIPKTKG
jgi:hypothetical protein